MTLGLLAIGASPEMCLLLRYFVYQGMSDPCGRETRFVATSQ